MPIKEFWLVASWLSRFGSVKLTDLPEANVKQMLKSIKNMHLIDLICF